MPEWELLDSFSKASKPPKGQLGALDQFLLRQKQPSLRFTNRSMQAILTSITALKNEVRSAAIKTQFDAEASTDAAGVFLSSTKAVDNLGPLLTVLDRVLRPASLKWIAIPSRNRNEPATRIRVRGKNLDFRGGLLLRDEDDKQHSFDMYALRERRSRRPRKGVRDKVPEPAEKLSSRSQWFQRRFGTR
jgi:hypothetical protein